MDYFQSIASLSNQYWRYLEEGIGAYTRKEFSHKLGLSYKELRETKYWLKLLLHSNLINKTQFSEIHSICEEVGAMLYKSIKTSKGPKSN